MAELLRKLCDDEEFGLFAGIAHRVWLRRNEFVHDGKFTHLSALLQQAMAVHTEYKEANSQNRPSPRAAVDVNRWDPPPDGYVKINWDTTICSKRGVVGMGTVVRNHVGEVLAVQSSILEGRLSPLVAEAWASGQALRLGKELGLTSIILEGDAKLIVDVVNVKGASWSSIGHLVENMNILLQDFPNWRVAAVRWSANRIKILGYSLKVANIFFC